MKKKKHQIKEDVWKRRLFEIKKLSLNDKYEKAVKEFQDIIKEDNDNWIKKYFEIRDTFGIRPYSINTLKKIEKAIINRDIECLNKYPLDNFPPVVGSDYLDKYGYLSFRIKPDTPRDLIHYSIDGILNYYFDKSNKPVKKERFRKEIINAIKVWEERILRKSFKQIAKELNIKESTAKKRFYRAYELLYDKKYDPVYYEKPEIKKASLKKECSTCKERDTCTVPCPDIIGFIEQDNKSYQREFRPSNNPYLK